VKWQVTIPANSQAELHLTPTQEKAMKLEGVPLEKSARVKHSTSLGGSDTWLLDAGTYNFEGQLAQD
jgi:hypothetical protein